MGIGPLISLQIESPGKNKNKGTTAAKNLMNFGTCFFKTQKFELFNLPQSVEGLRERLSVSLSIV